MLTCADGRYLFRLHVDALTHHYNCRCICLSAYVYLHTQISIDLFRGKRNDCESQVILFLLELRRVGEGE